MSVVMPEQGVVAPASGLPRLSQLAGGRNLFAMLGAAAVAAVMIGIWMWSQQPEYRVLFSNYSDRDGGAIVASLQQMNIPYKFAEGGGAILVPAGQIHDTRLKLAAQGLPKGGGVGFELMENQKLGVSQFLEQVNFQRALEGELARSIQAVGAVQSARVHLALPKSSVFVRDQQKPTASVLLNLHPGRTLDPQQVSAVVHLVASSVPELPVKNVTVVDQSGNLLSENGKSPGVNGLDPSQLKYVEELQQNIARRVESIITPIVGAGNVRAEATADVDFSTSEQAAEVYKPNQAPNAGTVRSQHSSETRNGAGNASGIPGALSNQPPAPATAPLTATPPAGAAAAGASTPAAPAAAAAAASDTIARDATTNYEVDKTVRYVQQPMGGIKRLSVAVVVNYRTTTDKTGKPSIRPLSEPEKAEITNLVKEAMGYNKERGDSLNVVNSPFAGIEKEAIPEVPIWKQRETWSMAKDAGKYLLVAALLLYLYLSLLKPLLHTYIKREPVALPMEDDPDAILHLGAGADANQTGQLGMSSTLPEMSYQNNLDSARQIARSDPRVVANVVKAWVGGND